MGIWYTTREAVKAALDSKLTARDDAQVDRCIESASRQVEGLLHRRFYPEVATRFFDWPNQQYARSWRLWLEENELVSVTTLSSGGTTISSSDYFLEPANSGSPYRSIEIDLDSTASFGGGNTHQRDIQITGVFGHSAETATAGALAEALDASEATVDVNGACAAAVGVGSILQVESERMVVTARGTLDTTQNQQSGLSTAAKNDVALGVTTGSAFAVGEVLLLDSERLLITDISGNTLTVIRGWDGSVLATHSGADIYGYRTLTVTRGALGTTAATHADLTAVLRHVVPGTVFSLCVAEAVNLYYQERSGYGRTVGSADNEQEARGVGLADLRAEARRRYGRQARVGVI